MQDDNDVSLYERLFAAQESQIEDLRRQNDDLRQSLAVERKRGGVNGIVSK